MLDQAAELEIARAVTARMTERGLFNADDCVMLIGSSVSGFGHARSDLDLLVCGGVPGRLPLHMFHEGRRVDIDFLYPSAWHETEGWVNACAVSPTQPFEGRTPPPVDDREWWSDHLWLYDRVVHGVPVTERIATGVLEGAAPDTLSAAIDSYSRALCARMMQRARMHTRANNIEAACQYECEALLAAVEAVAAARGITFWSDRTILEKGRRVQTPADRWHAEDIQRLFSDQVRRAWGIGAGRSDEVPGALRALLGPDFEAAAGAGEPAAGHLELVLADGWQATVAAGEGYLLAPDRSLWSVSPAVARFLVDRGDATGLAWPVAAMLAATGAVMLEPGGPVRPAARSTGTPMRLLDICPTPVAPSPEAWLSSRVAAQWYAMTVWGLADDLRGAVESAHRNRIMPILRKAELYLRMLVVTVKGARREVSRNLAMDLQGCALDEGFQRLADLAEAGPPEDFQRIPELAVEIYSSTMAGCGLVARADMFERGRSFMKQVGDVRRWFQVSAALDIPIKVPNTLAAKGGDSSAPATTSVFLAPS